jgi:hypothetical protein
MARAAETEVLRGDGMEHDRSTPVIERSYTIHGSTMEGSEVAHTGSVTASAIRYGGLDRPSAWLTPVPLCGDRGSHIILTFSVLGDRFSVVTYVTTIAQCGVLSSSRSGAAGLGPDQHG